MRISLTNKLGWFDKSKSTKFSGNQDYEFNLWITKSNRFILEGGYFDCVEEISKINACKWLVENNYIDKAEELDAEYTNSKEI